MMKLTKYLALFFLMVFTLPRVYQDIHILSHHTEYIHDKADQKNVQGIIKPGKGICVICNFEFAVSNFPLTFFYQIFIALIILLFIRLVSGEFKKFAGYHFSSRAPPSDFNPGMFFFM